jgi:IclR family pca regulon transcriptional regulator
MAGLAKGLAVVEAFGPTRRELTVTSAAAATGMSPATARRCLLTLAEAGYLSFDGKFFRPTPRMTRLGSAYLETAPLPLLAQPHVLAARDELEESVSLAVLEDESVVFVARAEVSRIVSTGVRLGSRLPAHASASGRVLLAALDDEEIDVHLRRCSFRKTTPRTLTSSEAVHARIEQARVEGVAFTDEEIELGMRTMAVPVHDARGVTHSAMSVSVFSARASLAEMTSTFLPALRRHADRLGRIL